MKKAPVINPEKIHLIHIDVVESSVIDVKQKSHNDFNIEVAHTTMHNLSNEKMKIGLFIDLIHTDISNRAKATFVIDFHFKIDELNQFYELKEPNHPVFHGLFVATLLGICFSTARGMIYERLSNTNMQGIILPVVSPTKILQYRKSE